MPTTKISRRCKEKDYVGNVVLSSIRQGVYRTSKNLVKLGNLEIRWDDLEDLESPRLKNLENLEHIHLHLILSDFVKIVKICDELFC